MNKKESQNILFFTIFYEPSKVCKINSVRAFGHLLFKNPIYNTIRIFKNSFLIWKTWVVILESELVTSGYNDSPYDSSMSNPNQYFSNICIRITWRILLKCRSIQQVLTEAWDSAFSQASRWRWWVLSKGTLLKSNQFTVPQLGVGQRM